LHAQEPQNTGKVSYEILAVLATIMIIGVIITSIVTYTLGYRQGQSDYIHNNCTVYRFLLLPSNQYWACRIPSDQLPGGGQ
jgi:hypothetical protein